VLRVIREILAFQPKGRGTDLGLALEYLNRVQQRRAVCFVLSDFQAQDFQKPLRVAGKRHDLVALSIRDPREQELPRVGLLELTDAETGERAVVDTFHRTVRDEFAQQARGRWELLRQVFRSSAVDQVEIRCDQDYMLPLIRFFRMRERRV